MGGSGRPTPHLSCTNREQLFTTVENIDLQLINNFSYIVEPFFAYCRENGSDLPFFPPPLRLVPEINRETGSETWCIEPDWRVIRDLPVPGTVLTYLESPFGNIAPVFAVNCEEPLYFAELPDLDFRVFTMIVELDQEFYIPKIEIAATTTNGKRLKCARYLNNNSRDLALFCLLLETGFIHFVIVHGDDSTSLIALQLPKEVMVKLEEQLGLWASNPCPVELFSDVVINQLACLETPFGDFNGYLVDYYMFTDPFREQKGSFDGLSVLEPVIDDVRRRVEMN